MTQLGKFLSDLPELIQQISWLQDYQIDGALRLPGEEDPGLQQETEPFEEYLVPVSYTHLDVYKRQAFARAKGFSYTQKVDPETNEVVLLLRKYS